MSIDDLTLREMREIKTMLGGACDAGHPFKIGQAYFIRTVTMYYTGILERVTNQEVVLNRASWIADTGRYYDALKSGEFNEVEPIIGPAIIGRGSIIDAVEWPNALPEKQK